MKSSLFEKGRPLYWARPFINANDTFLREPLINVHNRPFIRDAVDVKRWMVLVIMALFPTIIMAIWNTGVQQYVYGSGDATLMEEFLTASRSLSGYFSFTFAQERIGEILKLGCFAFLPILVISYGVGIICEWFFAAVRGHEIAEGFLVSGMLYPLILPPTIPYWMAALGIAFGIVIGKELFGGTGMNILNPALTARAFLFFTFPGNMSGDIWIGTNQYQIANSVQKMNVAAKLSEVDGFSQATALSGLNTAVPEIKRIHVDAIASNVLGDKVPSYDILHTYFDKWNETVKAGAQFGQLTIEQMRAFLTAPLESGGLALMPSNVNAAYSFSETMYGFDKFSDGNLFFGNIMGSMGETSTLACLLGAFFLIFVGVGSWRTMLAFGLGAYITASLFQIFSHVGIDAGVWNSAKYALPAWRHMMLGGLAFGLVFMATDPVSSPSMNVSKWIYGALIGAVTILIRVINPAYPEGVMLAILFGNVFAPLFDYYAVRGYRRRYRVRESA